MSLTTSQQQAAASIVKWFQSNGGFTIQGACGVVGNMMGESGLNPKAIGDHGTSGGLCQWHNERFTNLKSFASSKSLSWDTLEAQLPFLMSELGKSFSSLLSTLKSTSSIINASNQWGHDFERFSGYNNYSTPTYTKRSTYAQEIYSGVTSGNWQSTDIANVGGFDSSAGGSGSSSSSSNSSSSEQYQPRAIMASRGTNTVYQMESIGTNKNAIKVDDKRKDKFKSLLDTFSDGAPELGRSIVKSAEMYGPEILKGQISKISTEDNLYTKKS